MPNRYVRESWIDSQAVDSLDASAERFFLRLILKADDFGRYTANPVALKNTLFPLKDDVRATDSSRWLAACEKAGLVRCYETAKGRFLEIPKFGQRARAAVSRYPSPDEALLVKCQTDDRQTPDKGKSSAPEDEDEDEDDIRGRDVPTAGEVLVLEHLNAEAKRQFRKTETNLRLIRGRLDDVGDDVEGVKVMVTRMVAKWGNDPKMAEYLRPETLFRKEKFGGYYDNRNLPVIDAHTRNHTPSGHGAYRPDVDPALAARLNGGGDTWEEAERPAAVA